MQQCSAACTGDKCIGLCNTTAGFKGTIVARCTKRGWAAAEGACTAVLCPGLPAAAGAGARPWPRRCNSAALNTTCTVKCNTSAGYTGSASASCLLNAASEPEWSPPDNRCVRAAPAACSGTPPFDLGRKAWWDPGCNGTRSGSKCWAYCLDPYQVSQWWWPIRSINLSESVMCQ
jgi:hypothetical protein